MTGRTWDGMATQMFQGPLMGSEHDADPMEGRSEGRNNWPLPREGDLLSRSAWD